MEMEDVINDALDNDALTNETCNKVSHCKMVIVQVRETFIICVTWTLSDDQRRRH